MRTKLLALFLFITNICFCQNETREDFDKEFKINSERLKKLEAVNKKTTNIIIGLNNKIKNLEGQIKKNTSEITNITSEVGLKIEKSESTTNSKLNEVDNSMSRKSLYSIIGILIAVIISSILYFILSKRQLSDKSNLLIELSKTRSSIEETLVKEFGKQTEAIDTQLSIIEKHKEASVTSNIEPDHSLALKVASEINLIERNVKLMDSKTKGLKQLNQSVAKLKDNLAANGYEMPELLDKQFHQGMKVIVTVSLPDDTLEKGEEKITKVLIPQVNYNDKMIQTAQIEVSVGY
jgi:hypothetical protein